MPGPVVAFVSSRGAARCGSSGPGFVAASGDRWRAGQLGLVGSSHRVILWSLRCHTFPSPGRKALSAAPDHRGGCLVSGDVVEHIGVLPVLAAPDAAVGGIDR